MPICIAEIKIGLPSIVVLNILIVMLSFTVCSIKKGLFLARTGII